MSLSTPIKIKTLQRKLYSKAKQEPDFCFYVLYDKLSRADILQHAYALARSNKGAPGVDGCTFEMIEAQEGEALFLADLTDSLRSHTYQASAVRRVWIPKPDGSERPLGIPTIRDRVVQTALKLVIEPIFEADFCEHSYGFRPKRSAHQAADAIAQSLLKRRYHVIDADLSKYFDTIPHAKLMSTVAERINDGSVLGLIKQWLEAPVVEEDKRGKLRHKPAGNGARCGTPQGGVISPLLANLYLHLLDRIWERHRMEARFGARLVRYADDLVICCGGKPDKPMRVLQAVLARLGLTLNEQKTTVVDAREESFDFLGFSFRMRLNRNSGKFYPHVEPSRKSLQRFRTKCKGLTDRRLTPMALPQLVTRLNRVIQGWCGYFHFRNSTRAFAKARFFVEERMRTHLRRRYKVGSREHAYKRFPTAYLYEIVGVFKMPTTAAWKTAHA